MAPDTAQIVAAILNSAWMVRHYRGARNRLKRSQAILHLGLTVRHGFSVSDDFEALLTAVLDGLRPDREDPF